MELATSTSTSGIKDKFQKNVKMMRAICNWDLHMLVIPVRLMPSVYYVTILQETVPWLPQNHNSIYIQIISIAKTNLLQFYFQILQFWEELRTRVVTLNVGEKRIKISQEFAMQANETTDITSLSVLLAFVIYIYITITLKRKWTFAYSYYRRRYFQSDWPVHSWKRP
jgi:hypothetical protein